jgi:hypothetical protein
MTNKLTSKNIWTGLAAAALFMATLGVVPQMSAAEARELSQKQVNELITNAKEPQDHLRIAHYYTTEADRLEATAKQHEEMAAVYSKAQGVKNLTSPTQSVGHCEFFIKSMREAEKADRELAAEHQQMAKDATARVSK